MLSLKDLKTVRTELFDAATKWYDIGLEVGLECSTLDNISGMYQDSHDCLREMIKCFLKQVNPRPTWQIVVEALKAKPVNLGQLAEKIEKDHCKPSDGQVADPSLIKELRAEIGSLRARNDRLENEAKKRDRNISLPSDNVRVGEPQPVLISELQTENDDLRAKNNRLEKEMRRLAGKIPLPDNVQVDKPQPGFETTAQAVMTIANVAATYEWMGAGFRLTVPEGALPVDHNEISLKVQVSTSGQYDIGDFRLASPVYWIQPSPDIQFVKPLTIEIQHCAKSESQQLLSFIVARKLTHKDGSIELPYKFIELEGGKFTRLSCYGSIKVQSFSGFAVALPHSAPLQLACYVYSTVKYDWRINDKNPESLKVKSWCIVSANLDICRRLSFLEKSSDKSYCSVVPIELENDQSFLVVDSPSVGKESSKWITTPVYGKRMNLESSENYSLFPFGICQLISTVTFLKQDCSKDALLAELSGYTFNLLGAKAPNNEVSVLPIGKVSPFETCFKARMDFIPLTDNAIEIQIRLAECLRFTFENDVKRVEVVGAFCQLSHAEMTALSDYVTLKIPARSGDWEFVMTSPSGSTFKVPSMNKTVYLSVLAKAVKDKPSSINTTFVLEGIAAPMNTLKVHCPDPELTKVLADKQRTSSQLKRMKSRSYDDEDQFPTLGVRAARSLTTEFGKKGKPQLDDLLRELCTKVSHQWQNIGILLKIDAGKLDDIKTSENNMSQNCLREMLTVWMKQVNPPPSWSAIADAIESLGDEELAEHLRTKYVSRS